MFTRRWFLVTPCAVCLAMLGFGTIARADNDEPRIQIAILLDTSGSMEGLIAQAKSQLWKIVNEASKYRKDGKIPRFEVALYEYGKSSIPSESGYLRQILPFTSDLDAIAEQLFVLTTNGGEEYCGLVIDRAVHELEWSSSSMDLKLIVIAGNEPFTQGPMNYRRACAAAISKGIAVSTIHCGPAAVGIESGWKEGAILAEGVFANLDQEKAIVTVTSPYDDEIVRLGSDLNKTYIPYGRAGHSNQLRQANLDKSAATAAAQDSAVERSFAKSSFNYRNESWDLVDAVRSAKIKLAEIEAKLLPPQMQSMTATEQIAFLDANAARRLELQKKIEQLKLDRERFLRERHNRAISVSATTLDQIIHEGLRKRAKEKGFVIEQ